MRALSWGSGTWQLQHAAGTTVERSCCAVMLCPTCSAVMPVPHHSALVPKEEQRRISNRESCRDEWFNLMKEVAAQVSCEGVWIGLASHGQICQQLNVAAGPDSIDA